ncbi:MAG: hypothetical protein LBP57_00135 [Endomicrobium sp.]|jgi:hypothetical protein|nr:hypothetical protein [Endomicrobium sp.]
MTFEEIVSDIKSIRHTESKSLEESINILNKYKNKMTPKQYEENLKNVYGFAIEDMFLNEIDFETSLAVDNGKYTYDEWTKAIKYIWMEDSEYKKNHQ